MAATVLGVFAAAGLGAGAALASAPQAFDVRGALDKALKLEIQQAIGSSPPRREAGLDARRRAQEAGQTAVAVLRSEGYYDYQVTPDIGDGDQPQPFITIVPGPRSKIANPRIDWVDAPPDPKAAAAAEAAMKLKVGDPGRADDILAAEGADRRGAAGARLCRTRRRPRAR